MIRTASNRRSRLKKQVPCIASTQHLEPRALLCDWSPLLQLPDAALGEDRYGESVDAATAQQFVSGNGHTGFINRFCSFPGYRLHSNIDEPGDVDVVAFRFGQSGRVSGNTLMRLAPDGDSATYEEDSVVSFEFLDADGNALEKDQRGVLVEAGETIYLRVEAIDQSFTGEFAIDFRHTIDFTPIRESTVRQFRDLDGDGTVQPLTDGIMLARYFAGMRGDVLVEGAINPDGIRNSAREVEMWLLHHEHLLDLDGDKSVGPLTDGVLNIREMAGFSGESLLQAAVNPDGTRLSAEEIYSHLDSVIQELPGCEEFCQPPESFNSGESEFINLRIVPFANDFDREDDLFAELSR